MISPDGVAPSRMVGVSADVNLPLHHKVQKYILRGSGTGSPGWSRKKGRKTVVAVVYIIMATLCNIYLYSTRSQQHTITHRTQTTQ